MLTHLSLTSFCGIDQLSLDLRGRTSIQGVNGSGKTHILDAIHLLSGATPLYGNARLSDGGRIAGQYKEEDLAREFGLVHDGKREFFLVQGARHTRPKYLKGLPWRTVYISPFDMNLLYFAPSMRRDEFDLVLSQAYAQFGQVRRDYDLTMRQRNTLLKRIREGDSRPSELEFWDTKFAELADTYRLYRKKLSDFLVETIGNFPSVYRQEKIAFFYQDSIRAQIDPTLDIREGIVDYLQKNRERDILTGHTHIGPHRDDWGFLRQDGAIDPLPAQNYLSRGEMKMLLLAFKMVEADFLAKTLDLSVIVLIDDIFAELDEHNSEVFLDSLRQYQVILTSQKPLPNQAKYGDFICINLQDS